MRIQFEEHKGTLDIHTQQVTFYGMVFSDILASIKILKHLPPGNNYEPWCYKGHKGFLDPEDGSIFMEEQWLPDVEFAKNFIRTKGKW